MSYYDRPDSILNRAALNIRKPDEQEPDPMLDPDSDSFAFADLPRDTSTKAMDYVRAFQNGVYGAPGALGDFAETTGKKLRQSGQNQSIPGLDILQQTGGALLEAVGRPISFIGEKVNNFGHQELSQGAQNAMQDGTIPGIVLEATQATGSLAGDAIAGGAIRKALTVAQKAGAYGSNFWRNYSKTGNPSVSAMVAAKAENAVKTPGLTPYIAGTSLAHAQGGAFESVRQSVRQLSPQELAENEEFVREFTALRNDPKHQQLSDPDIYGMAIQSFADQAAMNLSTDPRLIALNVVATATGTVPLLKTVFKGASRPLAAMATGLAREGIVNAGQEAGTQYLINEAQNNLGFSIDSQEGVADAAKRGFATGGLMGLAGGGISGTRYRLQQRAEQNARLESRKNADSTLAEKYQRAQDIMQPQQPRAAEPSATDTTAQPQTADSLPQDMLKQIREMDYQQAATYTASAELAIARGDTSRIPAAQAAHSRMEQLSIQQDIDELKKIPQRNEAENHELSGLEQRLNHITRQLSGQTAEHQPQNPRTDGVQAVLPPPQLTALPAPGNIHPGRGFPMPGKPGLSATDERAPDGHRFTTRKIIASKTGKPFRGSGSARASQTFRQAQAQGLNPAVIKQGRENYVIEADAPAVPHKAVTQAQAPAADIPPQATPRVQTAEPPAPPQNAGHNYMAEPDNKTPSPVAAERKTAPPPQAEKPQVKQQAEPESHKPVNSEEDLQTRPARPEEANHLTGERNAAPKASKGEKTPSQAEAQKPAKTESPRIAEKSGEKIDDFGETIHGAAKHRRAALSEELNTERTAEDYKTQPFSKLFPKPDYVKLAQEGADSKTLAMLALLRSEIPARPRVSSRLDRWAKQVEEVRDTAGQLLDGSLSADKFIDRIRQEKGSHYRGIVNTWQMLHQLSPAQMEQASGYRISSHGYSTFEGKQYNPPKVVHSLENEKGSSILYSEDLNDLHKKAKAYFDQQSASAKSAGDKTKLDIYQNRHTGDVFIAYGKNKTPLQNGFKTPAEARGYAKTNRAELLEKLNALREQSREEQRNASNRDRNGPARHEGDVTPEQFSDAFGFRGVQFGNYVEVQRRQSDLNRAYDSLMDMADVLKVPAKALSLNGRLGLAFGARGKGGKNAAAAHYEPDEVAINLTKGNGAGSLAHEWFHALDNFFGQTDLAKDGNTVSGEVFITSRHRMSHRWQGDKIVTTEHPVRQEVYDAFKGVMKAVNKSGMGDRALRLDEVRSKPYWSTDIEMAARAFERYVQDKAQAAGVYNDFLVNIRKASDHGSPETYAYPTKAELDGGIRQAFDQLFSTLKTKETDKGVVFYSKDLNKEAFKVPEEQAQRYRTELAKALNNKKTHEQYISVSDTPAVLRHLGAPDLPLSISKNVVTKAIKDKHEVMIKTISRLPELIHNPRAVYRSATKDNAFVILLDSKDRKGNPVVSAIHLSQKTNHIEVSKIASVYGTKGGWEKIQKMEHDGLAVYRRNPDDSLLMRLQLPVRERFHQGSATKVLHAGDIGNKNNVNPGYAKQADKPQHLDMKTVAGIAKEFVDRYKGNLNLFVRVYPSQEAAYGDWYNNSKLYGSYDANAKRAVKTQKGIDGQPFDVPEIKGSGNSAGGISTSVHTGNHITDIGISSDGRKRSGASLEQGGQKQDGDKNAVRGLVRLNAAAFKTKAEAETTLRHEILGHYGLNTFSHADKLAILDAVSKTENNPDYAGLWETVKHRYPDLEKYDLARAEEIFAHAAQQQKSERSARTGKRIIPASVMHAFHQALRKSGMVHGEMPIKELYDAIDATADGIRAGRRPQINFPPKNGYEFGRYLQRHGSGLISDTGKSPAGSKIQGMSVKQVQVITGSMMKDIADKDLRVKVVKTQAEAEALAGEKTGDRIHAMYQPHNNTIVMVADNLQMGMVREKLRHELIHHALEKLITPQQHAGLLKAIGDTRASKNPEIQRVWRQVEQNYAGSSKDIQTAEFLSHMAEHHQPGKYGIYWNRAINAIKNLLYKAGLISDTTFNDLHQLKETLHTLSQRLRSGYIADNSASTGNTAHARQANPDPFKVPEGEGERYRAELAKAMKSLKSVNISIEIGRTPPVLRHLGVPELPLVISRDTVRKATNGVKHVVPMNVIERLPELMHNPEAVYRSATQDNALVVLMNAKDKNGDPVVSAVHLQASAQRIEINRIASVYGAFPGKLTKMDREGLALYKKQNPDSPLYSELQLPKDAHTYQGLNPDDSQYSGLQLPKEERFQQGSDKKILHSGDIRNSEGKTFYAKQKDFSIEAPEETYAKLLVRKLQDKFRILKDVQDNIRKAGGKIDEASDAYLAEELHYGKTENDLTRIQQRYIEPLAKLLADYKISREQLDEYLYARHAKERNAHIAEINPDNPQLQDGGSGMTSAEADRILRRIKSGGQQTKFDRLAGIIDDMLKDRRELLENYGLEDADIIHTWQKSYKYYVPLKGWAASPAEFSRGNKRALGRTSQAQSPSVQAIQDLTESIIRARKNEVGNALLKLVTDNPDKNYWQIFTQEQPDRTKYVGNIKDETGKIRQEVRTRAVNMQNNPKYFATKVNGKTWYIKFADQRLMDAMQTLSTQNPGWVLRKMAGINRFMSRLATSLSPVFLVRNFIRDQSTAHMFIQAEATRNDGRLRGISNPTLFALKTQRDSFAAMRAIYTDLRGSKPDAGGATWQKYWRDFQEDGAKTGWIQSPGFSEAAKRMDNIIAMHSEGFRGMSSGVLNSLGKLIEDGNSAVENALRLSAYRHAIESGISRQQAASLAKNLTVNFNRRGEWGVYLNSLYMFANASVQGTANVARAFFYLDGNGPLLQRLRWKNLNNAQKIGIVSFAASFALSSLNRVAGGQDDDGRYWYDKVPQYDREHNLIIMKSLFGMGKPGAYWKIPLPYGYNWFWHLADNASSVLSGGKTAGEATRQSISSAFGAFSPVGSEESQTIPGTVFKNAVPSVFRPAYSLLTNENFAGQPITQKRFPGDTRPDSATGKRSTGEAYKTFSRWLNRVTGGDDTISGSFDISPDQLSYLVASYTSSPGRLIDQTIDLAAKTASGKTADINPQQIPFRGIHNSQVMPYADTNRLYSNLEELSQIQAAGTGEKRAQFRERWKNELGMTALAKQTRSQLQAISRQRNAIYASPHLTGQQVSERLRQLDKQDKTITDKFNKTWDQRAKK